MKKILQFIFPNLFPPDLKGKRIESHAKSNFDTPIKNEKSLNSENSFKLEFGKTETILMPKIMEQENFEVIEWLVGVGDLVKRGQVICVLENENIAMEFESFTEGKILFTCEKYRILNLGEVLFKITGI